MTNEELVKAIEMSDLANGELNPEQQSKFIDMVFDNSVLMKAARHEEVTDAKGELSKLHIGEPITRVAPAGGIEPSGGEAKPKTTKIEYSTTKLVSWYDLPTDLYWRNIAREGFEDQFMGSVTKRIANDMELLMLQGDSTAYAAVNTPTGYLLRALDGWLKKSANSHVISFSGASVTKGMFAKMARQMPDQYSADPGLRWIMSTKVKQDWLDYVAERDTAAGDEALKGNGLTPYGIPILAVPFMPNTLDVSVNAATPGAVVGTRQGPFETEATAKTLKIAIDAGLAVEFSLSVGVLNTTEICNQINAAMGAVIAFDAGWGSILLKSPTVGATSAIILSAPSGNSAYTLLGFTAGTYSGSASGTAGDVPEGSRMILSNPMNLIAVMLKKTRIFSEFKPRKDALEVTIYNEVDAQLENIDAMVFGTDIRLREL